MELLIPFGKYKGKQLDDDSIPASYLIWVYDNIYPLPAAWAEWLDDNLETIQASAHQESCDATEWDLY